MNNSNDDSNSNKKLLKQKRKPPLSLEEIVNIYCKQHNIEDNEISKKIRTIYYHNPEQNILIDYNKDRGDEFPLSRHLQIRPRQEEINYEEEENYDEDEKEKEKINIKEIIKDKNEEQKIDNSNEEKLLECFICGWIFLKEMSFEEKNRHINFCIEGVFVPCFSSFLGGGEFTSINFEFITISFPFILLARLFSLFKFLLSIKAH